MHLDGGDARLRLTTAATGPYLEFANGGIQRLAINANGLTLDVRGYRPLKLTFAQAAGCTARWNNRALPFIRRRRGSA